MSDSLRSARPALRSTRTLGGRYIDIRVDRLAAARYGLSIDDVQTTAAAVGDMPVDEKLEGFARFPIIVRFPRETRDSLEALRVLPIVTAESAIVLLTLPFALMGGIWLIYLFGHAFSVATAVGFIALAGLAAEFDVIMLVYLEAALMEGAVQRVRPKAMTAAVILAGLLPLLVSEGTGPEVMQRLAAPMVGSMITAPLLSLFVIPAIYKLLGFKRFHRQTAIDTELSPPGQTQTA